MAKSYKVIFGVWDMELNDLRLREGSCLVFYYLVNICSKKIGMLFLI